MDKEFNLISAIRVVLKWKKQIIGVTLLSGIIAALFAVFVMDEYYLSWATFYPTNQSLYDRTTIFNTENATQLEYFGSKADVNRVLTIANSNPVIDFIIDSFHLASHYDIDTTSRYWKTRVRKKFESNYEAIKTDRDAVEISLYDTDPKLASAMVSTIVSQVDDLNQKYRLEVKRKNREAIEKQIQIDRMTSQSYMDTLADLGMRYHIKVSAGADGTMIVDGNDYKAVQLYKSIMAEQTSITRELNNLITVSGQIDVSLRNVESSIFVLDKPFPADRRSKPVRSLVVIITMLITGFISVIGVLLIDQVQEIKKQL